MERIQQTIDKMKLNFDKLVKTGFNGEEADKIRTENGRLFSQFMAGVDDESNLVKQCFYPDNSTCSKTFIFAHSIQRKKMERIAKDGKVIKFVPFMNKGLSEAGINSTTTFKGFCDKHDKIFSEIEQKDYADSDKQNYLYFYRTLCKYHYDELASINQAEVFKKLIPNESFMEDFSSHKNDNDINFNTAKQTADQILLSEDYAKIHTWKMELGGEYNILNSTFIWPHTEFNGTPLPNEFKFFTLNIFSENSKTYILMSCFEESKNYFSYIDSQLLNASTEEKFRLLNLLITYEPRNMAYNPEEFALWTHEQHEEFMNLATDEFHINPNHFKENITYSFFRTKNVEGAL